MFDVPPSTGCSRASTARARISCSPTLNTAHVSAGLKALECPVVQDLFLNETANYAHVLLPARLHPFLEKDGTFTNAERRIQRIRKMMSPKNGLADWEVTQQIANALGLDWNYEHPSQIMDEVAALDADLHRGVLRAVGRAWQRAVAVQRRGPRGHANHAPGRFRARSGPLHPYRVCRHRREGGAALPAAADHRPNPQPAQRLDADAADSQFAVVRRGCADPPAGRRGIRRSGTATWSSCKAGPGPTPCTPKITDRVAGCGPTRPSTTPTPRPMW